MSHPGALDRYHFLAGCWLHAQRAASSSSLSLPGIGVAVPYVEHFQCLRWLHTKFVQSSEEFNIQNRDDQLTHGLGLL